MPEIVLSLVPADRFFVPSPEQSALARRIVTTSMPESSGTSEIDEVFPGTVHYFETGQELEETECPVCNEPLSEEIEWWSQAMRKAHETGFFDLRATTPCCRKIIRLNDLPETGAFASYGLTITNPPKGFLTHELKQALEAAIGARLHAVYRQE